MSEYFPYELSMCRVLILIILEVTLWELLPLSSYHGQDGLNPYYIGSYSMRPVLGLRYPYQRWVLILIILEVTLWDNGDRYEGALTIVVLILIILEVTLWENNE